MDAFTLGEGLMEEDGRKKMSPIFLFGHLLVVFTAEQKHLGKRFWKGPKIATFGD